MRMSVKPPLGVRFSQRERTKTLFIVPPAGRPVSHSLGSLPVSVNLQITLPKKTPKNPKALKLPD